MSDIADPFLDMMENFARGRWDGFDAPPMKPDRSAENKALKDEQARQAAVAARVFATDDGKALLEILFRMTFLRPPGADEMAAMQSAEAYAIAKARRDGQNDMIFQIINMLQRYYGTAQTGGAQQ